MLWDIFCMVIDNHGDIGVCWRLSAQLGDLGHDVRLWVDDASALAWMAPAGHRRVRLVPWRATPPTVEPGDCVIEAFGCELDSAFQAAIAARAKQRGSQPAWINLEYLSAEGFAERCHGLPSPILTGPAAGLAKRFFYPGFTPRTGGLLRERDLPRRQSEFDGDRWLAARGIVRHGAAVVSLFCYEPAALAQLLQRWAGGPGTTHLLVTAGRAGASVGAATATLDRARPTWNTRALLTITQLPHLSQSDYDCLLWSCDLNFVRGEDSLVRALWAGKPLVWQIYPQDDGAHHAKLDAFLDWLQAPASMRAFHATWVSGAQATLPMIEKAAWGDAVRQARGALLAQKDLASQLAEFAAAKSTTP